MENLTIKQFKAMLKSGAANLANHQKEVDALNVFPVPDGDTGTNMSMTFTAGYKEADRCYSEAICDVAKALSKGLLMGARGNSGVITSQIFRGFFMYIDGREEITPKEMAEAFENGARVAYKAIMKPVEGTILTVIREASWYANHDMESHPEYDFVQYMEMLVRFAKESVDRTPELLPVLKEVGVVDSGGTGLLYILEGFLSALKGEEIEFSASNSDNDNNVLALDVDNEEFGYCTEFIVRLNENSIRSFNEDHFRAKMAELGESLVVVRDDDLVKVHVHTLTPGDALNTAQRYGEFIKLKIENMSEQHSSIMASNKETPKERKKFGIITVAMGSGLTSLFKEFGADIVISGGQTMNPSTEDFVAKIKELEHCDHIFIFPNNGNIILAANQAKDILSDVDVTVIETRSIPEGLSAISMFNHEDDKEDAIDNCKEIIANVFSSSVTYAIKDTSFDGIEVKKGDYIAMAGKSIIASDENRLNAIKKLLDKLMENEEAELLTLIAGEDSNEEEVEELVAYVENNSDLEVTVVKGDQPVYCYLLGLE